MNAVNVTVLNAAVHLKYAIYVSVIVVNKWLNENIEIIRHGVEDLLNLQRKDIQQLKQPRYLIQYVQVKEKGEENDNV